jgi:hypothetical protein
VGIRAQSETLAIWRAQGKCCAICGAGMVPVHMAHPSRGWTIEHVFHRASKRYYADGNKLVTHAECNNRKGDREPTGCEIILLHAVNAKLGFELTPYPRCYCDNVEAPSALAVALERAMAA